MRRVTGHGDRSRGDGAHPLHEESSRIEGIAQDDELARAREPARCPDDDPVAVAERRLHAVPGDRQAKGYFLVAQKMSEISLTAACKSAAAWASTVCLFFEQSLAAFQNVSWSLGYFSRCSGLK